MQQSKREIHGGDCEREHGGAFDEQLGPFGLTVDNVLDFSANINPYGPLPRLVAAVQAAALTTYPDPTAHTARRAIGDLLNLNPARIVLGNGATELIWTTTATLLSPGDRALVIEPTFSEFKAAVRAKGGMALEWRARASEEFALDLHEIKGSIRRSGAKFVYFCVPNNPTGIAVPVDRLSELSAECPTVTFLFDQAFLTLSDRHQDLTAPTTDNTILLRSLTKEHTIPGLRVGYLVTTPERARLIERTRPYWTTSAPAQAAATAAARESQFLNESRSRLLRDRVALDSGLRSLGLQPVESTTSFVLVEVGAARPLRNRLLQHHRILVRDCTSFGLPRFIRIAVRPSNDTERLVAALGTELKRP